MASSGLSGPAMDPAVTDLLDDWLDQFDAALLAPGRLRDRIVEELHDGLLSATERHLADGVDPVGAARAAVCEFGDARVIAVAYSGELTAHRARRIGVTLVASGPLVGLAWLGALAPPVWPPRPGVLFAVTPLYFLVLAVGVPTALLAIAATGPLGRWLPRDSTARVAATVAATACVAGDALLLAILARTALSTPAALAWQTGIPAAAAGITRLVLAARAAHQLAAPRRHSPA